MASADQISRRNLGRQSWASAPTPRGGRGTARRVVVPHGWLRRAAAIALGSGAQRGVCGAGAKKWAGIAAEIIPKVSSNAGQSLSHGFAVTAPFTQGSLWGRGNGLPRRFAPRNDSPKPLPFRGGPTGRRGNPSFLRWTGVRAAVPRAWPPPTKFPSEIWGVGQVVGPYGKPKPAGAQRSVRARSREGWAEISAKTIKRGTTAATAEAALSEAESAEREAGQIRSLPDDLRVQHGAQRSEVSARPRPCSRRGCVH